MFNFIFATYYFSFFLILLYDTRKKNQEIQCNICVKNIGGNAKAVCCDVYDNRVHIKCNGISTSKYEELCEENNDESFICIKCFNSEYPLA